MSKLNIIIFQTLKKIRGSSLRGLPTYISGIFSWSECSLSSGNHSIIGSVNVCWWFSYWIISEFILFITTKEDEKHVLRGSNSVIVMYWWEFYLIPHITSFLPFLIKLCASFMCSSNSLYISQHIALKKILSRAQGFWTLWSCFVLFLISLVPSAVPRVPTINNLTIPLLYNKRITKEIFSFFLYLVKILEIWQGGILRKIFVSIRATACLI